ncbi:unnamed protein product [Discosporangium mesarthrocarpum]
MIQCLEEVSEGVGSARRSKGWPEHSGGAGGRGWADSSTGRKVRTLLSTNIYRKAGGRWLMVHHHASIPAKPVDTKKMVLDSIGAQLGGVEGIEGMPRIINLSADSVAGGMGIEGLDDILESLRSSLSPSGFTIGSSGIGGPLQGRSMIVIGDDEDDEEEEESISSPSSMGKNSRETNEKERERGSGRSGWRSAGEGSPLTDNLTKKTMEALRMLGAQNKLGRREQRRLITDVIEHAAGEEASAVEVAYELLLAHHNEDFQDKSSLGEFVEQCKVLASSLLDEDRRRRR